MKSTMKSTFAIIAVVLMVLVAVVPMVSVFTGSSDAAAAVESDPTTAKTKYIDVTVKLYDANKATQGSGTGYVQIVYGNGTYKWTQPIAAGDKDVGTTFRIYEKAVDKLEISCVDADKNDIKDFPHVILNKLEAGKTYTADLISGHLTGVATFYFANGDGDDVNITDALVDKTKATIQYKLYTKSGDVYTPVDKEGGNFTLYYDGHNVKGYYVYPVGLTDPYIAVTNSNVSGISFNKEAYKALDETASFSSIETLVTVASNTIINFPLEVTLEGSKGGSALKFTAFDKYIGEKEGDVAYFTVDATKEGDYSGLKMTVKKDSGSDVVTAGLTTLGDFATYNVNNAFFGRVTMNGTYVQDGSLKADIESETEGQKVPVSGLKTSNGYFFAFVKNAKDGGYVKNIELTVGSGTSVKYTAADMATGFHINSATNIALTFDGIYNVVSGNLKMKNEEVGVAVVGTEIKVTGANTFGSLTTIEDGAFSFMSEVGKNIILSIDNVAISGDVSVVVDGESTGLKIYMAVQKFTVAVQDALGNPIGENITIVIKDKAEEGTEILQQTAATYDADKEVWSGEIRGDVDLSKMYVFVTSTDGYTFSVAEYKAGVVKAKQADYTYTFYKASGDVKAATSADDANIFQATIYKNSDGAIIYNYDDAAAGPKAFAGGVFTAAKIDSSLVSKKVSDIGTTPITAYVIITADSLQTNGIFKKTYLFTVDADGECNIIASADSLSAKLTRINEVTPISGIKVEITLDGTFGEGHTLDIAYTQADGSFTLYTDAKMKNVANTKIKFTDAYGYTFVAAGETIFDDKGEKKTVFTAASDAYALGFVDADGALIDLEALGETITTTVNGEEIADSYVWKEDDEVAISMTYTAGGALYRTFETYVLTAEDVASGLVAFTSEQYTYGLVIVDAADVPIAADDIDDIDFIAEFDGITYGDVPNGIPAMVAVAVPETVGIYTFTVTDLTNTTLLNNKVTGFAVEVTSEKYGLDGIIAEDIESVATVVEAPYATITYKFKDASGAALSVAPGAVTAYKDGVQIVPFETEAFNKSKIEFINDPDAEYAFSFADSANVVVNGENNWYTFDVKQEPVDDILYANEQWIYGDVVDAKGNEIADAAGKTITATAKTGSGYTARTAKYVADAYDPEDANKGMFYKMLVDTTMISGYTINAFGAYTFASSSTPVIYANEQTILFSAMTANGCEIDGATFTAPKAYNADGVLIGSAFETAGVIADVDNVAYFKVDAVNVAWDILGELNFNKESLTSVFTANESYLTGTVPFCGKDGTEQEVEFDFYLDGNLVSYEIFEIEGYEYEVLVDLSGMVVNGVAFDSIEATYYENGVEIGSAVVDPNSAINNIISPIIEIYVAELLPPSALVANHVDIEQIGVMVTVTADSNFMIADDEGVYTDGQYTYTFAGWYVNNQKVSANPVYTFELTDDVVISPQYTVTYEKTSDANDKQTPQPQPVQPDNSIDTNVLIIGICAVIVALIAVVYAVIKKE